MGLGARAHTTRRADVPLRGCGARERVCAVWWSSVTDGAYILLGRVPLSESVLIGSRVVACVTCVRRRPGGGALLMCWCCCVFGRVRRLGSHWSHTHIPHSAVKKQTAPLKRKFVCGLATEKQPRQKSEYRLQVIAVGRVISPLEGARGCVARNAGCTSAAVGPAAVDRHGRRLRPRPWRLVGALTGGKQLAAAPRHPPRCAGERTQD